MKRIRIALFVCLLASTAYGTQQFPEKLLYKGQEYRMACLPLEKYFRANNPKPLELRATNTACWRGYIGTWEIRDKQLFLKSLGRYKGRDSFEEIPISVVFKDQKSPVKATWYTGVLRMPHGKKIGTILLTLGSTLMQDLYVGHAYGRLLPVYEKDLYLGVVQGNVISEHLVDNTKKGATRSVRDWGWVASGSGPVKDDFKWYDLRDVTSEAFSQHRESGKSIRTRGVFYNTKEKTAPELWIPRTAAAQRGIVMLKSVPQDYKGKQWQHVEIKAHFEKESGDYFLHVDSIRPLKPGETMHHRDFKPPEKSAEKTR